MNRETIVFIILGIAIATVMSLPTLARVMIQPQEYEPAPAGVHRVIFECQEYGGHYDCTPIGQLDDPKARAYK